MAQNAAENRTTQHIRAMARNGALPHALIISGSGDRLAAARFAAAAMQCRADADKPCCQCTQCRKVLQDIHPDVLWVEDTERKELGVDAVRELRQEMFIRPNDDGRKVAIFPNSLQLNDKNQNVLLKIVEEGPPYAAFLFCAENPSGVLQTLRSRCVELKLRPAADRGESLETAEQLCRAIGSRRRGAVMEVAVRLEKKKLEREQAAAMLEQSRALFAAALLSLYGRQPEDLDREIAGFLAKNLTKTQIMSTIEMLEKYHGECAYNVGTGHLLGALAAELEGIL